MKKLGMLMAVLMVFIFSGCKSSETKPSILGTWQELPTSGRYAGESYWIQFNSDNTFKMKLSLFNDGIIEQPCPNNRNDYVMGSYSISGNNITFSGHYCDSDFITAQATCEGVEVYEKSMPYEFSEDQLVLGNAAAADYKHWLKQF